MHDNSLAGGRGASLKAPDWRTAAGCHNAHDLIDGRAGGLPKPMAMLSLAVARGMDAATIKGFMDLQERWEKSEAERRYNEAFAAFKAEAVQVIKNKQVTDGPLKGKSYAELFAVVDAVDARLSKHGLSHRGRSRRTTRTGSRSPAS
jgi:hypothetical protein